MNESHRVFFWSNFESFSCHLALHVLWMAVDAPSSILFAPTAFFAVQMESNCARFRCGITRAASFLPGRKRHLSLCCGVCRISTLKVSRKLVEINCEKRGRTTRTFCWWHFGDATHEDSLHRILWLSALLEIVRIFGSEYFLNTRRNGDI